MKGEFEFIDKDNKLQRVSDSDDIPSDAKEVVRAIHDVPPSPHTDEDHEYIERTHKDFARIKFMIYGDRR